MAVKATATITLTRVNDGAQGPAGKGIKSTSVSYQAGISGTTAPTGTWSSSIPTVPLGQYLWSRHVVTYTDDSTSTTYSVAYIPQNGKPGSTGKSVVNIIQQYYLSTSKTTQTGGTWVTTMPTWSRGKYLWTRFYILYANPTSTAFTNPVCDSSWEAVNDVEVELEKVRAEFEIEKDRITSTVEKTNQLESKTSILEQTAEEIKLEVSDLPKTGDEIISKINLSAGGAIIESSKIDLKGYVTVSDLSGKNTTVIDGSNIKSGTITANHLNVNGGRLGGWYFVGNRILSNPGMYIGSKHAGIMLIGDDNNQHIYVQDANGNVQFDVNKNGYFIANNADITGNITANSILIHDKLRLKNTVTSQIHTVISAFYNSETNGITIGGSDCKDINVSSPLTANHISSNTIYLDSYVIVGSPKNGSWIGGGRGGVALNLSASGPDVSTINGLARVKTPYGAWTLSELNSDQSFHVSYFTDTNIDNNNNVMTSGFRFGIDGSFQTNLIRYVRSITIGYSSDNHRWDLNSNNSRLQLYQSTPNFAGEVMAVQANGSTSIRALTMHNNVFPVKDNGPSCGTGGHRFSRFYAVNASIGTSDANEKTDIKPIDERYEKLFMKLRPVNYKWKNFSEKDNHDRVHSGLIAQEVEESCLECGLDSTTFAAICKDELDEPTVDGRTKRYGMAYSELHGLEIHMIQKNIRMIEELKSEIKLLKARLSFKQSS